MLIAVVSDTHKQNQCFKKIINKIKDAEVLIHLGDNVCDVSELKENFKGKIINVKGNCDLGKIAPLERIEEINGKKIFITHGHRYDVKYNLMRLKYKALEVGADIILYGHTHISHLEFEENMWFINPGSAARSRGRFNSIALINIEKEKVEPRIVEI